MHPPLRDYWDLCEKLWRERPGRVMDLLVGSLDKLMIFLMCFFLVCIDLMYTRSTCGTEACITTDQMKINKFYNTHLD